MNRLASLVEVYGVCGICDRCRKRMTVHYYPYYCDECETAMKTIGAEEIPNKSVMYDYLTRGLFGNALPQYGSVEEWRASGDDRRYPSWGVRTKTTGGPCRLLCPTGEVETTVASFAPHLPNISVMISSVGRVNWLGDVTLGPGGWVLSGVEYPERYHDWRSLMRSPERREGLAAALTLKRHLNPNSLADLEALAERFPGHVYELSCLDTCFGTVPGRNAILWEVRTY